MKILLIVDAQNDFCPGGRLAVTDGDKIIPVIDKLMKSDEYDLIIASKDWHPEGHESFARWGIHCVQNSPGAEIHPGLDQSQIAKVILKGLDPDVDSYSAFFDNEQLHETELRVFLEALAQEHGCAISDIELDIVGLATDICVAFTAFDAKNLGFETTVIIDGCRALSPEGELATIKEFAARGIKVIESIERVQENDRAVDYRERVRGLPV